MGEPRRKLKKKYTIYWLAWAAMFVVIEGAAIFNETAGDTLSEHVWGLLDHGPALYFLVGGPLIWLVWHLLGKGRWG